MNKALDGNTRIDDGIARLVGSSSRRGRGGRDADDVD